ncbi:MAG: TolC family protein, partial [Bacteroidaceae bacterium]
HPKMNYLDSRMSLMNANRESTKVAIRPKVSLYANGYYGNPGFNLFGDMIKNEWTTNLRVGLKMSWNIGALYTYKKNLKKIEVESQKIEVEKDIFLFNTKIGSHQESRDIIQKTNVLREDDKIIVLRNRIVTRAEKQFEQGVILASDFLREVSAHEVARINRSTHEIDLLSTIYQQKQTLNGYEK